MAMGTLNEAILMGRVCTSGEDIVSKGGEEFANSRVVEEFASLVEIDVFVFDSGTRGVPSKECSNPCDGGTFSNTGFTVETSGKVISSKYVTGLAVEASIVLGAILCLGALSGEGKIKTETLIWDSSLTSRVRAGRSLFHFGLDTNGASIEDRFTMAKLGDTINVFVGIIKMLVTNMVETLMPEETFGRDMKLLNLELGGVSSPVNIGNKCVEDTVMGMSVIRRCGIGTWQGGAREDERSCVQKTTRKNSMELDTFREAMFVMSLEGEGAIGMSRERPAIGAILRDVTENGRRGNYRGRDLRSMVH
jgi:hypothetical protein